MRRITKKQFNEIKRYTEMGAGPCQIAKALGIHYNTVKRASRFDTYLEYYDNNTPKEKSKPATEGRVDEAPRSKFDEFRWVEVPMDIEVMGLTKNQPGGFRVLCTDYHQMKGFRNIAIALGLSYEVGI